MIDDLIILVIVAILGCVYLLFDLFVQSDSTRSLWEQLDIHRHLLSAARASFGTLDERRLTNDDSGPEAAALLSRTTNNFVLSTYSPQVCRSMWRIVEYVLSDFVDPWWGKISDGQELQNDLRGVFDHAFNVLGSRLIVLDWNTFIIKNVVTNLNYLLRIYRLTEQEFSSHNTFFAATPEAARHRLIKAELMRTYKLHVAVGDPAAYMRKLSTAILSQLLRPKDFKSETVATLTREILTSFILTPVMKFADPFWLNIAMVKVLAAHQVNRVAKKVAKVAEAEKEKEKEKRGSKSVLSASSSSSTAGTTPASTSSYSVVPGSFAPSSVASKSKMTSRSTFSSSPTSSSVLADSLNDDPLSEDAFLTVDQPMASFIPPSTLDDEPQSTVGSLLPASTFAPSSSSSSATVDDDSSIFDTAVMSRPLRQRKESMLLTQKMSEWDDEKEKRHLKLSRQSSMTGANSRGSRTAVPSVAEHPPTMSNNNMSDSGTIPPPLLSASHSPQLSSSAASSVLSPSSSALVNSIPLLSQLTSSTFDVRILSAGMQFDPKPFVSYQLLVINGELRWTIWKRFNRFEELHAKLKKSINSFDAQLPAKKLFGNLEQSFITTRKAELQTYLGQLVWNKNVQECIEWQAFLMSSVDESNANSTSLLATIGTPADGNSSPNGPSNFQSSLQSFFSLDSKPIAMPSSPRPHSQSSATAGRQMHTGSPPVRHSVPNARSQHDESTIDHNAMSVMTTSITSPQSSSSSTSSTMTPSLTDSVSDASRSNVVIRQRTPDANSNATSPSSTSPSQYRMTSNEFAQIRAAAASRTSANATTTKSSSSKNNVSSNNSQSSFTSPSSMSSSSQSSSSTPSVQPIVPPSSSPIDDASVTDPIYLLVEEIFNLNGRGWMRRQATWVGKQVIRLSMDSMIKNKMHAQLDSVLNEVNVTQQIDAMAELIWPNGTLMQYAIPPTADEMEAVKIDAKRMLIQAIPSKLGSLLGKDHTVEAMEKCFDFMQMEPLIQHFAYSLLDSLVLELFPSLANVIGRL